MCWFFANSSSIWWPTNQVGQLALIANFQLFGWLGIGIDIALQPVKKQRSPNGLGTSGWQRIRRER